VEADLKEIGREINVAEAEFQSAFQSSTVGTEWRSATIYESITDYVSRECRSADLIITSALSEDPHDTARPENPGDIVMQAGRPVLVVPRSTKVLGLDRMVVAWKNTREARRAIADALPLLALARNVTVVELAHEDERTRVTEQLTELCGWLKSHGIAAEAKFVASGKGDDAYQLDVVFRALGAGVVVAGAYGHSRFREWALGGVTRDLTLQANYCTLLSH
jgi:nucleotide-binding universal stress UspA family protein